MLQHLLHEEDLAKRAELALRTPFCKKKKHLWTHRFPNEVAQLPGFVSNVYGNAR